LEEDLKGLAQFKGDKLMTRSLARLVKLIKLKLKAEETIIPISTNVWFALDLVVPEVHTL